MQYESSLEARQRALKHLPVRKPAGGGVIGNERRHKQNKDTYEKRPFIAFFFP